MLKVSQLCPQSLLGTLGMGGYSSLAEDGVAQAPRTQIPPMALKVTQDSQNCWSVKEMEPFLTTRCLQAWRPYQELADNTA